MLGILVLRYSDRAGHTGAWVFRLCWAYWCLGTQVKVNGPVHARSKHARYMHNDAQV